MFQQPPVTVMSPSDLPARYTLALRRSRPRELLRLPPPDDHAQQNTMFHDFRGLKVQATGAYRLAARSPVPVHGRLQKLSLGVLQDFVFEEETDVPAAWIGSVHG